MALDVNFPAGVEAAFVDVGKVGIGAMIIPSDSSTIGHRVELSAAIRHRLPSMFANRN